MKGWEKYRNIIYRENILLFFLIYSFSLKTGKRETVYSKRDAKKSDFLRDTIFNGKYTKENTFSVKSGIYGNGSFLGQWLPV